MRTIKFKIWDKESKSWLGNDDINYMIADLSELKDSLNSFFKDDSVVVCQFIGLKDKYGTEIYEGDVVTFDIDGVPHGPQKESVVGEVWFCEEDGCWALGRYVSKKFNPPLNWWYNLNDRVNKGSMEIIGNIFENGELLK